MMGVTSTRPGGAEEEENERRLRSVAEARSWFPQRRGQRPESGRRSPDAQTGGYHWGNWDAVHWRDWGAHAPGGSACGEKAGCAPSPVHRRVRAAPGTWGANSSARSTSLPPADRVKPPTQAPQVVTTQSSPGGGPAGSTGSAPVLN